MAKKVKNKLKMQLPAGQATPGQKVGQALGPYGLNLMEFCKRFNDGTKNNIGDIIPVEVTIYEDRTYDLAFKTPPAADLLRKAAGIEKGAANPLKEKVGKVSRAQIRAIAEKKMTDLNANDVEQACKIIEGTARSMGIKVE